MSRRTERARHLRSPRYYAALRLLRKQRCTVRELLEITGANGVPQLISRLRSTGFHITTHELLGKDRYGRTVRYCEYELQPESYELVDYFLDWEIWG
jgi:hypothetical protein